MRGGGVNLNHFTSSFLKLPLGPSVLSDVAVKLLFIVLWYYNYIIVDVDVNSPAAQLIHLYRHTTVPITWVLLSPHNVLRKQQIAFVSDLSFSLDIILSKVAAIL